MPNGKTTRSDRPRAGLRDRLSQTNELQTLPSETLEQLLNLPDRLKAAAQATQHMVSELTERQRAVTETERNLAHTIDRLRRQADRITWRQTEAILLALAAGTLGGGAAALLILNWMQ